MNDIILDKFDRNHARWQFMAVSYKKLWKLLIDKDMKKSLRAAADQPNVHS